MWKGQFETGPPLEISYRENKGGPEKGYEGRQEEDHQQLG